MSYREADRRQERDFYVSVFEKSKLKFDLLQTYPVFLKKQYSEETFTVCYADINKVIMSFWIDTQPEVKDWVLLNTVFPFDPCIVDFARAAYQKDKKLHIFSEKLPSRPEALVLAEQYATVHQEENREFIIEQARVFVNETEHAQIINPPQMNNELKGALILYLEEHIKPYFDELWFYCMLPQEIHRVIPLAFPNKRIVCAIPQRTAEHVRYTDTVLTDWNSWDKVYYDLPPFPANQYSDAKIWKPFKEILGESESRKMILHKDNPFN